MPISSGSQPATAQPLNAPSGSMPRRDASSSDISFFFIQASFSYFSTGCSFWRASIVVDGRLHSSPVTV